MAYNAANEERKELVKIEKGNRGDAIVASQITNKNTGNVSIDIRQFYTNDEGVLSPTSKGVRFSAENLMEVMKGLAFALEADELMDLADELEVLAGDDTSDIPEE